MCVGQAQQEVQQIRKSMKEGERQEAQERDCPTHAQPLGDAGFYSGGIAHCKAFFDII